MDEVARLEQRLELLSAALEEAPQSADPRPAELPRRAEPAAPLPRPQADRFAQQVSRLAAAGLVLGLASIFLYEFVVRPLLAVAVSGTGLWTYRPDRQTGLWMAIAGVVLGAIYTIASLSAAGHVQL